MVHTEPDADNRGILPEQTIGTVRAQSAAFIARSRTLIPELLDLLAAKDAEIARLTSERTRYGKEQFRSLASRRKLESELRYLTAERGAAIDDLRQANFCSQCRLHVANRCSGLHKCGKCADWEWRGAKANNQGGKP